MVEKENIDLNNFFGWIILVLLSISITLKNTSPVITVIIIFITAFFYFKKGNLTRQIPPSLISVFLFLLFSLVYTHIFFSNGFLDRESILIILSIAVIFSPYYISDISIHPEILFILLVTFNFSIYLMIILKKMSIIHFYNLYTITNSGLFLNVINLPIIMILALPFIIINIKKSYGKFFLLLWFLLSIPLILFGTPLLIFSLLLGITIETISLRSLKILTTGFFLSIFILILISSIFPGKNIFKKMSYFANKEIKAHQYRVMLFKNIDKSNIRPEEGGVGFSELRRILSKNSKNGHLEISEMKKISPLLLFPYSFGIYYTILIFLMLFILVKRLVISLKKTDRKCIERVFITSVLASSSIFLFLSMFTSELLLSNMGTPFFYLYGYSLFITSTELVLISKRRTVEN